MVPLHPHLHPAAATTLRSSPGKHSPGSHSRSAPVQAHTAGGSGNPDQAALAVSASAHVALASCRCQRWHPALAIWRRVGITRGRPVAAATALRRPLLPRRWLLLLLLLLHGRRPRLCLQRPPRRLALLRRLRLPHRLWCRWLLGCWCVRSRGWLEGLPAGLLWLLRMLRLLRRLPDLLGRGRKAAILRARLCGSVLLLLLPGRLLLLVSLRCSGSTQVVKVVVHPLLLLLRWRR